jgi:hypothetical protein
MFLIITAIFDLYLKKLFQEKFFHTTIETTINYISVNKYLSNL